MKNTNNMNPRSFADRIADSVISNANFAFPGATVVHVDQQNGSDAYTGGPSWEKPYATLDAAIDFARYEFGTTDISYTDKNRLFVVLVKPGHYNETNLWWSGYNLAVIGCGPGVPGKDYGVSINYDGGEDTTAAFLMSGSGNTLANVHITCAEAIPAVYLYNGDNNLIKNVVIECDGTNCTYGIHAGSMKGSRIEDCVIGGAKTAGIYVAGGADHYFINAKIKNNLIWSAVSNTTGILVDDQNSLVAYGSVIEDNKVILTSGSSCKGIDVNNTGGILVCKNMVSVPSSATAIEHAGGDQFLIHNATAAGTTNVDPDPAAGA